MLNFTKYINDLNEGLIKTYDIDFVIDKSLQMLSVLNINFDIQKNPNNTIKLNLYDFNKVYIKELFNLLNSNFVNMFGWFPSYMYMTNVSGMKNQMNYDEKYLENVYSYLKEVSIIYESKFDIEINIPKKLYHISIKEYKDKILKKGIIPKTKSKLSVHDNRIYVCSTLQDCLDMIPKMKFYFFNKNPKINTQWVIYEILTDDMDIKLYKDPNYLDKGYYLLGNIPPNNIKITQEEKKKRKIYGYL
jgi:hypothetical protein